MDGRRRNSRILPFDSIQRTFTMTKPESTNQQVRFYFFIFFSYSLFIYLFIAVEISALMQLAAVGRVSFNEDLFALKLH